MATHSSVLAWRIPWTEEPVVQQVAESDTTEVTWHVHTVLVLFPLTCCYNEGSDRWGGEKYCEAGTYPGTGAGTLQISQRRSSTLTRQGRFESSGLQGGVSCYLFLLFYFWLIYFSLLKFSNLLL